MIYHSKDQKPHSYNLISSISPAENDILPKQLERKRNLKQTMDTVKKKKNGLLQEALRFGTVRILKHKENYLIVLIFLACDVSTYLFGMEGEMHR